MKKRNKGILELILSVLLLFIAVMVYVYAPQISNFAEICEGTILFGLVLGFVIFGLLALDNLL